MTLGAEVSDFSFSLALFFFKSQKSVFITNGKLEIPSTARLTKILE